MVFLSCGGGGLGAVLGYVFGQCEHGPINRQGFLDLISLEQSREQSFQDFMNSRVALRFSMP